MLTEMMIRVGQAVKHSSYSVQERIELLTDVHSVNCKNYFQNVFVVEIDEEQTNLSYLTVGTHQEKNEFVVDQKWSLSFPIIYPNGGNPLKAQGVYPIPCYLLYDPHIKSFSDAARFVQDFLLPRLNSTVSYKSYSPEQREQLAERIACEIADKATIRVKEEERQLGILMIVDRRLPEFRYHQHKEDLANQLWIMESSLFPDHHVYLDGETALQQISEAKFVEAGSLGREQKAVSTFTNQLVDEVVSVYNKSWLWLSPTWDMPKPLHWKDTEWTKGIKLDRDSYESFLYGTQAVKKITQPLVSAVLKEMFAPINNSEAKKHMKATSFEQVYGAPILLPLLNKQHEDTFRNLKHLLKKEKNKNKNALQLKVIAGLEFDLLMKDHPLDDYRLTLLYYSGDLSRGNMHIRAVIEDVVPSVASQIEDILQNLNQIELPDINAFLGINGVNQDRRLETLPSLLANAYGPGYVWSSLEKALHRQPLTADRVIRSTATRLNELANKRDHWGIRLELLFYFGFMYFLREYTQRVVNEKERSVNDLSQWKEIMERYHQGEIDEETMYSIDALGFVTGLMLKQFENSYYHKTNKKEFFAQRVMKFGAKLTPEMIWKNGVLQCPALEHKWKLKLAGNFHKVRPAVHFGFNHFRQTGELVSKAPDFINMFWAGFYSYQNPNKQDQIKEETENVHS
ncbi:MAG: hypothetical protein H0Z34_15225 [Brevibacillus sp.]|nr:hypothetical protein [Brevibacillus sp.]